MWTPLLTGELAERAMARAREIAIAQAATPTATAADRVLYWAYTSAVFDEPFANDAYGAALDDLVASLQTGTPHLGLFGGLANAGWVLCHTLDDDAAVLDAIDDALLGALAAEPWMGAHDLIEGLVGFGVYFVERIAHGADRARDGLARVVAQLERTAQRIEIAGEVGATWHTPLSIVPPSFATDYPEGFYDCGIAHGVPGMIGLLARAAAHVPGARDLAIEAARWLDAQRTHGAFPARIAGAVPTGASTGESTFEAARTAWCYGDPGIALGLWATRTSERSARAHGAATAPAALALAALRRDVASARVTDATLCHGAAGLGHIAHRLFHATRDPAFADAARVWMDRACTLPIPDDNPAFLDGSAGVGLALVAAATPNEPAWDRLLLADLTSEPEG